MKNWRARFGRKTGAPALSIQVRLQDGPVFGGQPLIRKLLAQGHCGLIAAKQGFFPGLVQALQRVGFVWFGPPTLDGEVGVGVGVDFDALPPDQEGVFFSDEILWSRKISADQVKTILQCLDQSAAEAFAAMQRQIAIGTEVEVCQFTGLQGFFDEFDAGVGWYPLQGLGAHVLPAADLENQIGVRTVLRHFQKNPQHGLWIFSLQGGVQIQHIKRDKGLGRYAQLRSEVTARGAVLHHRQGQGEGELARLFEKGLLHKPGGAPDMVHQPQGLRLFWGKVGQFPQKVAHLGARHRRQAGVLLGQTVTFGGGHEKDTGAIVLRGHVLPGNPNLALHIGGHIDHRKGDAQMVQHGGKRAQVFAQTSG